MRLLIIDADGIPFRVASVMYSQNYDLEKGKEMVDYIFKSMFNNTNVTHYYCIFSGKNNFRKVVDPTYKLGRLDKKLPINLKDLKELKLYIVKKYKALTVNNIEADDLCTYLGSCNLFGPDVIIGSDDLDLKQIPGMHYLIKKNTFLYAAQESVIELSENRKKVAGHGYKLLWSQMLTGDKDECDGLKGYGPVSTINKLKDVTSEKEASEVVYECYLEQYKEERLALQMLKRNLLLLKLVTKSNKIKGLTNPVPVPY